MNWKWMNHIYQHSIKFHMEFEKLLNFVIIRFFGPHIHKLKEPKNEWTVGWNEWKMNETWAQIVSPFRWAPWTLRLSDNYIETWTLQTNSGSRKVSVKSGRNRQGCQTEIIIKYSFKTLILDIKNFVIFNCIWMNSQF